MTITIYDFINLYLDSFVAVKIYSNTDGETLGTWNINNIPVSLWDCEVTSLDIPENGKQTINSDDAAKEMLEME